MNHHFRHLLAAALLLSAATSIACDADVLRLNYRKAAAPKSAAKAATVSTKVTDTLHKNSAPPAALNASIKLEPR